MPSTSAAIIAANATAAPESASTSIAIASCANVACHQPFRTSSGGRARDERGARGAAERRGTPRARRDSTSSATSIPQAK